MIALACAAGCYNRNQKVKTFVKSPLPWEYIRNEELPKEFDPYVAFLLIYALVVILTVFLMSL